MTPADESTGVNGYRPTEPIGLPPIFSWPLKPVRSIQWLLAEFLFPWGFLFIGMAAVSWNYLTPNTDGTGGLSISFIGLIFFRNFALLVVVAGGLHWWLYRKARQGVEYKFSKRWMSRTSSRFLWRNQVYDNAFWSLVSGVSVWSLFEALTLWAWIKGVIPQVHWTGNSLYLVCLTVVFFFASSSHFYLIHRTLHWTPLYRGVHELHHRNVNTGPWTGLSMHPVEHLMFFSMFFVWWLVPTHPTIIILTGFFKGLGPAVSHSGFGKIRMGRRSLAAGDWFHDLHHRHFEVNYGNVEAPFDWARGTWHDGSEVAKKEMVRRRMAQNSTGFDGHPE